MSKQSVLLVAIGCLAVLAGSLWFSHAVSTPAPMSSPADAPVAELIVPTPPPSLHRIRPRHLDNPMVRPAPRATATQRPEFDEADADIAHPRSSRSSVQSAYELFERCMKFEPENERCKTSRNNAQARLTLMPPDEQRPTLDRTGVTNERAALGERAAVRARLREGDLLRRDERRLNKQQRLEILKQRQPDESQR